jgi:Sterol carrier protein domain
MERFWADDPIQHLLADPRRYRLDGGRDAAAASRTEEPAGLLLDAASLASAFLGDTSIAALHRAGLVEELRPGAVATATAMFTWSSRPLLNHMF